MPRKYPILSTINKYSHRNVIKAEVASLFKLRYYSFIHDCPAGDHPRKLRLGMVQKNHIYLWRPKRYLDKKDNIPSFSFSNPSNSLTYVLCLCRCSEIVHLTIALGLLFSYTLQFHIALMLVWPELVTDHGPKRHKMLAELGVRLALALSTCQFLSTFNHYTAYIDIIWHFLVITIIVL